MPGATAQVNEPLRRREFQTTPEAVKSLASPELRHHIRFSIFSIPPVSSPVLFHHHASCTMYSSPILRMQPSRPYAFPTPKEGQSAHTISQRLRTLKKIPPELIPLGVVLGVAVGAAIYSSGNKLMTDKTLRLTPNRPEDREH
ncbi:hypothetical protein BDW62DRAFT_199238 [Aspergillus aurantiobrunneus]